MCPMNFPVNTQLLNSAAAAAAQTHSLAIAAA
jgi:hypothetical protein